MTFCFSHLYFQRIFVIFLRGDVVEASPEIPSIKRSRQSNSQLLYLWVWVVSFLSFPCPQVSCLSQSERTRGLKTTLMYDTLAGCQKQICITLSDRVGALIFLTSRYRARAMDMTYPHTLARLLKPSPTTFSLK